MYGMIISTECMDNKMNSTSCDKIDGAFSGVILNYGTGRPPTVSVLLLSQNLIVTTDTYDQVKATPKTASP